MAATSTPTPIPVAPPAVVLNDNHFAMHDAASKTKIVYNLQKGGPLTPGSNAVGPELTYTGPEGNHTFSGPQVSILPTPIGSMITVTLNVVPDLRTLTLSVMLPDVANAAGVAAQSFETMAFVAAHHTTLLGPAPTGGNPTYSVIKLQGQASHVLFPD